MKLRELFPDVQSYIEAVEAFHPKLNELFPGFVTISKREIRFAYFTALMIDETCDDQIAIETTMNVFEEIPTTSSETNLAEKKSSDYIGLSNPGLR